jgi:hypothetical protein
MSNFFENLSKIAETINDATTFIQGIKADSIGKTISNKVVNSITKSSPVEKPVDPEKSAAKITLNPSVENKIPVLYGRGLSKGTVVDAALDADGQSIWISYVISETTGDMIDGTASEIKLKRVFADGYNITFASDGVTALNRKDTYGNTDSSINGLIKVYFYNDGSTNQSFPVGFTGTAQNAYDLFPTWNSGFKYYKMVFAIVKITYSQENDLTYLPDFTFDVENTMTQPGDVLYDYLTSTRYGGGVPESEIRTT